MDIISLKINYLKWHYGQAFVELFSLWGNLFWFLYRYFSIPTVLSTLISPWKSMGESYGAWYQFSNFFSALIVNTMMRIVGLVMRLFLLVFALCVFIGLLLGGIFSLLFWILAPAVIIFGIVTGIFLLF